MDHFTRITAAEEQFAREVTLNILYLQPPKMWQNLIPGMFIFDFLRRTGAIRRYTRKYMFPRKLAMQSVSDLSSGVSRESVARQIRDRIDTELQPLQLASPSLAEAYQRVVEILTKHYHRLIQTQEQSHDEMVRITYGTAKEYEIHLRELSAAEKAINETIVEAIGPESAFREDMQLEADQIADRRRKMKEKIFGPAV